MTLSDTSGTMSAMTDPPSSHPLTHPSRTERLFIRVTTEELNRLDQCAAREQRTRSDMARILINRGTEQR